MQRLLTENKMPDRSVAQEVMWILANPSVQAWITSGFWWIAHYLYVVSKWTAFNFYMLLINMFLAYWIGTIAYVFIPDESTVKGGIVWIVWFSTYPILSILEQRWLKVLEKYLNIKN